MQRVYSLSPGMVAHPFGQCKHLFEPGLDANNRSC